MITAADIAEIVKDLRTRSESCEKLAATWDSHTSEKKRITAKGDAYKHAAELVEQWGKRVCSNAPPSSG